MHCRQAKRLIPEIHRIFCILIGMEKFNTYIEHIEPEFWRELCMSEGKLRHFEKGEEFVRIGSVARYVGYIKSGTMKYVAYSMDGTEHVVGLEFAGEFVADFPSSLYDNPSIVSIIAVKPCDVYCFPTQELAHRIKNDERLKDIVIRSSEAVYSTVYSRYVSLYSKSPQERFDELVSNHPDMFSIFPLKDIASYLKITPTHLSRLRRNYKNQHSVS